MAKTALVWKKTEGGNKIIDVDDKTLVAPNDDHFVLEVPENVEDWRVGVDDDGELVIAYDGEDTETALASLLADQEKKTKEDQEAAVADRGD
jgi:hypothetical protein